MHSNNELVHLKSNPSKSTNWRERIQFRKKNKWLSYSSQIARRVLAAIEGRPDLNQAKLASEIDVSAQYISKIVKGQENLTLETIYKLAEALETELIVFPPYKYSTKLLGKDYHSTSFHIQGSFSLTTTITISDRETVFLLPAEGFRKILSVPIMSSVSGRMISSSEKVN